jgi:hypothetical protein
MNLVDWLRAAAELVTVITGMVILVRWFMRNNHAASLWFTYTVYVLMTGGGASLFVGYLLNIYPELDPSLAELSVTLLIAGVVAFSLGGLALLVILSTRQ